ncbi:flagellar basal body-associated FliL family protein [Georgenia ruanii]|uniref:Flagellar protein FliL n=1 Tax=Georgenia ruanii TaxID=348442 RepID=A0A7J9UYN0_9MICO|nr:flagellar basal body-associated FliL family protein [Georgenia ruanii]MPV89726.1 flagellar basal body rod protein [Georgenia ruanii]
MVEQRTVGRPVNVRGAPAQEETRSTMTHAEEGPPRRRRGLVVLVVLVVVLAAAAAAYVLRPWESDAAAPEKAPELGLVVPVDPISVNLADGHYLRLGFSIQLKKGATKDLQVARALDIAIATYSGKDVAEVNDPARREELKAELLTQLSATFKEVVDVYLTDYVTQ